MLTLRITLYVKISHLLPSYIGLICFKVDIENLVNKVDIAKFMNVNFNTQVIFCRPKAQCAMSTLRPKSICVNTKGNLGVNLSNFDLNNSTQIFLILIIIVLLGYWVNIITI